MKRSFACFALCILSATTAWAQVPVAPPAPAPSGTPGGGQTGTPGADPARPVAAPKSADKAAAPVKVEAKLSSVEPKFGDKITVEVTLTYPTSLRVFFPARPNLKPLLSLPHEPGKVERAEQAGMVTEKLSIPVLVVKSGLLRTPPIEVPYHAVTASGGAGESGTVTVPSLRAIAKSQFAGDTDVKAAPMPTPLPLVEDNVPLQMGLFVGAMMLIAALLTFVGLRAYKNRVQNASSSRRFRLMSWRMSASRS